MKIKTPALVLLLSSAVSACVFHAGNSEQVSATTLGQELVDLKLALDQGVINDSEYQAMRAEIIDKRHAVHSAH